MSVYPQYLIDQQVQNTQQNAQRMSSTQPPMTINMTQSQPSYAFELPLPDSAQGNSCYESLVFCLSSIGAFFGSIPGCCCCTNPYRTINQGKVGLVSRFGKLYKGLDPGLHYVLPVVESLILSDIRLQIQDIPSQMVMTKDNVSIYIDSVLYWHILDPTAAVFSVTNLQKALIERTMTTLRMTLGSRTVQECVEHREALADEIQDIISPVALTWGVKIDDILLKDLRFSEELVESLSSAAKQQRIGESKIIAAQAEVKAAKLMKEASDILNAPSAMQIRYLDTLVNMSKVASSKVIFMPSADDGSVKSISIKK